MSVRNISAKIWIIQLPYVQVCDSSAITCGVWCLGCEQDGMGEEWHGVFKIRKFFSHFYKSTVYIGIGFIILSLMSHFVYFD